MMLIGLGLTVILSVYATHKIDRAFFDREKAAALQTQKETLVSQCNETMKKAEAASNVYQEKISTLSTDLAAARRMFGNACITVSGKAGSGSNGATSGNKSFSTGSAGNPVINGDRLLDLFAEGERYRSQVIGLQTFIKQACVAP